MIGVEFKVVCGHSRPCVGLSFINVILDNNNAWILVMKISSVILIEAE